MTTPQRPSTTCRRPSELFRQEKNKTKFSINQSINYQIALSFGVTYSKKKKFMYRASRINFYYIIQNKIRASFFVDYRKNFKIKRNYEMSDVKS
jgi:hypothetical protein